MRNIDQQKLNALDQQSKQVESEIKSLCAKGKRADAQKKADGFGEQMATDPTIQAMMKCGDMMKGLPFMEQLFDDDSSIHVCDELQ